MAPKRWLFECGCAWIQAQDSNWWQVVACPEHVLDGLPKTEPFLTLRQPPP